MSIDGSLFTPTPHMIQEHSSHLTMKGPPKRVPTPSFVGRGKSSGAQTIGKRYENRVGKYLEALSYEMGWDFDPQPWFQWGNRYCQPDFLIHSPSGGTLLFEVKYTWMDTTNQLRMYRDLIRALGCSPITSITICRNLTPGVDKSLIVRSFEDLKEGCIWPLRV